ncbi:MAG: hypothetical protein ACAI35_26605 [Candidatus Methylacidiphilales bacterium]|nr:hypothetical protein [Candidatus Methylacidiphilales bacterium]
MSSSTQIVQKLWNYCNVQSCIAHTGWLWLGQAGEAGWRRPGDSLPAYAGGAGQTARIDRRYLSQGAEQEEWSALEVDVKGGAGQYFTEDLPAALEQFAAIAEDLKK